MKIFLFTFSNRLIHAFTFFLLFSDHHSSIAPLEGCRGYDNYQKKKKKKRKTAMIEAPSTR